MRLIIWKFPIKDGWRDAHISAGNLAEAICQNTIYKKAIVFNGLLSKFNPSLRRVGFAEKFKMLSNSLGNLSALNFLSNVSYL